MSAELRSNTSVFRKAVWFFLLPALFAVLAFFTTISLRWKDQAILGFLLIGLALFINRGSKSRVTTLFLTLMACFCTARYAYYRYSETFWNLQTSWTQVQYLDLLFVFLLLGAETYSFLILFLGAFQTARPLRRRPAGLPEDTSLWPTVDVYIPTYNEPLDVVGPTVLAALTIDWPADKMRVFILDDGRRSGFEQFAAECGASYITRLDNAHAKAGNINHALRSTNGELIAIFDCDHVPTRSFLQMTVGGFLQDERLSMVQTPHHFYSPDPFERNLRIFRDVPNESALFYGIIQDGNDLWDATFFCGSCAVIRRNALEEVGGIAVETVTEDAHTALRLHAAGWKTSYISLPQAAGLATSRLADHIGQRIRWARGMVQILRLDNPLLKRGLKFPQRLCYLNSMMHYLFAGPRLIFLSSPLVYLIFGRSNVFGYLPGILAHGLPHLVLATMVNSRIQGRHRHSFWNEVYEIVLAPYIFVPTLLALINPRWGKFNVTAKQSVVEGSYFDWQIAKPFGFMVLANLIGIAMGAHRIWLDGDGQGVVTVNLVWAGFNTMTLGAAMAVAHEMRQIRSSVRVPAKLPMKIILENGLEFAGRTENLSFGGVEANIVRSGVLAANQSAEIVITMESEVYRLPVRVVETSGSRLRLTFGEIDRTQQAILTRLIFGRADTWINWSSTYKPDRPLLNLLRLTRLSLSGLWAGLRSLVPRSKSASQSVGDQLVEAGARQAALPLILLLMLFGGAAKSAGQPVAPPASSPAFRDTRDLTSLGHKEGEVLRGHDSRFVLHFGLPITKIVLDGQIALQYRASAGSAGRLQVSLNGSDVGSLQIEPASDTTRVQQAALSLSPDLFLTENTLAFEYKRACGADCRDDENTDVSVAIEPSTEIRTGGTLLPVPDRLDLLPAPFVGPSAQRIIDVRFVVDRNADNLALQAAGVAASWFGVKAEHQPTRFPVSIGEIPAGNVVLLAVQGSPLCDLLALDASAPSLTIRNNPNDPYGKVLAIVAPNSRLLFDAARAFALDRYSRDGASALLSLADLPAPRRPYDAPRWLSTDRPVRLAEASRDSELQVTGTGTINLYFNLAPDLYFGTRDTVPFHLRYRCTPLAQGAKATLNLRLNGQLIAARPIGTDAPTGLHEEIVYLPVAAIFPRNTLSVEFSFGKAQVRNGGSRQPVASVLKGSELMIKGLPHFSAMPRLDMFANTGFPFTRLADLSESTVVLPPSPHAEDLSLYLTMVGFMGSQTGYPALRLTVARGRETSLADNKNLLIIGAVDKQPLLADFSGHMSVQSEGDHFRVSDRLGLGTILSKIPWLASARQHRLLDMLLQSEAPVDGIVQGFVSPVHPDRSVVAVTGFPGKRLSALADDWASAANASKMYGTVSLFTGGEFRSFDLYQGEYVIGTLDPWPALQYWGRRFYWLSPILILACIWFLTLFWDRRLEMRAANRLALSPQ